jgi:low temperature requirement protein LtrA
MTEEHVRPRRWFRPPVLRTVENDGHERKTSWLELFYDLVLVVGIAKLAHLYSHHPGWHGALVVLGLYCAVFVAWQGFSFYADRFDTDDLIFRLATYAQMLCVIALSMQIDAVAEGHVEGFALAFGTQRTILVLLYARAYRYSVKARPLARRYGGIYGFGAALWLASAALPMPWSIVLWGVAIANDLGAPPTSTGLHREAPTDPAHVPERLALFTLIVLGELVVTVGIAADGSKWNPAQVATAIGVFGISICLWWEYFERLGGHELPHSGVRIVTYAYAHLVLLGGLLFNRRTARPNLPNPDSDSHLHYGMRCSTVNANPSHWYSKCRRAHRFSPSPGPSAPFA